MLREGKPPAQGHTARECLNWDLNLAEVGSQVLSFIYFASFLFKTSCALWVCSRS